MQLTVFERLILMSILPGEGNFVTLKIAHQLKQNLSFDEDEIKRYKFIQDMEKGSVVWDQSVDQMRDISIGEKAADLITDALKKLDKDSKLKEQHFGLYEKFVEGGK
jgi:hypothetical protein